MGPSRRSHSYRDAVKSVLVCISFECFDLRQLVESILHVTDVTMGFIPYESYLLVFILAHYKS